MRIRISMQLILRWAAPCILAAIAAGCGGAGGVTPASGGNPAVLRSAAGTNGVARQVASGAFVQACPDVAPGYFRCLALGLRDFSRAPQTEMPDGTTVSGYGPAQLQAAYHLTKEATQPGGTVVIVDAFGYPTLAKDLAKYRKYFQAPKCDESSGCLKVLNQDGKPSPLPSPPTGSNVGWIGEEAIDVAMVSANCPNCHIVMIQATTNSGKNLYHAERTAANLHPSAISNSWGGGEYKGEERDAKKYFDHPGIAIVASSGDGGYDYGVIAPSAFNTLTAVGGTTLRRQARSGGTAKPSGRVPEAVAAATSRYRSGSARSRKNSAVVRGESSRTSLTTQIPAPASRCTSRMALTASRRVGKYGAAPAWDHLLSRQSMRCRGTRDGIPASLAYSNTKHLYDVTSGSNGLLHARLSLHGRSGLRWADRQRYAKRNGGLLVAQ